MPLHLLTAPAGAGKTQHIIEQIRAYSERAPFARMLIILPSGAQRTAFRTRLGNSNVATLGVTLTDFHTLYRDILDAAGALPRLLPEAARYRLLRAIIRELAAKNQLPYFAPIVAKPGFITAVGDLIVELKEGLVLPERLAELARTPRLRDLATIYTAYQNFLRDHALADREGMGWLALDALHADTRLYTDFAYIAADGFDEFNPTQRALLDVLAARVPTLHVTLTYEPNRLAHARFARTFATFQNVPHTELAPTAPPRAAPLDHLERYLFELNAPRVSAHNAVHLIVAPDRAREVRAIARIVKQRLVAGAAPNTIGVLFRRLDNYQTLIREIFTEFGIPFRVEQGLALQSNPLIAALVNLLTLSSRDFPWRDTLDALRSPYFVWHEIDVRDLARIERITRQAVVIKGRAQWLAAFVQPTVPLRDDAEDTRLVAQLDANDLAALRDKMARVFERLTPPARATPREFVAWIEQLLGPDPRAEEWQRQHFPEQFQADTTSLRVIARARAADASLVARDVCALDTLMQVLRGILEASEILNEGELAWPDFVNDLVDALDAATYDVAPTDEGRVIIATITQARGVPRDDLVLGGLVESEFPRRPPPDPLLTAEEHATLRAAGVSLAALEPRDETTLFYQAVTLARQRLYLTYPTFDEDANPLYPSPYLEAVEKLFEVLPRTTLHHQTVPTLNESASRVELSVALTRALAQNDATARALDVLLQTQSPVWRHSRWARVVEARREAGVRNEFSGVFQDATLRAECAQRFGKDYLWSASQFNDWGACGFRFFAKRLLQLEETLEPEEGLDALTLGALYHEILAEVYREFAARQIVVTPATLDQAQRMMQEIATRLLTDAPTRFAFRPTAWWRQEQDEIVRRLTVLLHIEAERNRVPTPQRRLLSRRRLVSRASPTYDSNCRWVRFASSARLIEWIARARGLC